VTPAAEPVAVVGLAGLFPAAPDAPTFWENIVAGTDAISEVPPARWDPEYYDPASAGAERFYCRRGGFVDDIATFDPARFGIMPVAVDHADPDQFVALGVAAAALEDAGSPTADQIDPRRVGVILGRGGYYNAGVVRLDQRVRVAEQICLTLREVLPDLDDAQVDEVRAAFRRQLGPEHPEAMIGLVPSLTASRIANRLDLQGPAYTVDAACASSLVAVDQAVHELRSGRCDLVLAGGSHHCHDVTFWSVFTQLGALSRTGVMRPFDRRADGLLIGEGTGIVVLERLTDALDRGRRIYAVIRGTGVASDGRDTSLMRPKMAGQQLALERAWADAGLEPASIGLLEAHGTATPAGDRTELETVTAFFGAGELDPQDPRRPGIGSVKSMIGHAMPAAGAAGLIKAVLALHHRVLPPTLHCEEPSRAVVTSRFRVVAEAEPWERNGHPRRAGVNAFGFGGTNAHVVLEELHEPSAGAVAPPAATAASRTGASPVRGPARSPIGAVPAGQAVLLLAGSSPAELAGALDRPDDELLGRDDQAAVPTGPVRLALVAPTAKRLALARRVVAMGKPWRGRNDLWFTSDPLLADSARGSVAFLFPGVEPEFAPRVDSVAAVLGEPPPDLGTAGLVGFQAQAIVTVGRLLDRALRACGVIPDAVAGHSIGEMTAGLAAGLAPERNYDAVIEGIDVARVALPDTLFAALGCGADEAAEAVAQVPDVVVSHDNCPHQAIICGPEEQVRQVLAMLRSRKVMGVELPFRSGFHSPMFAPYLAPMVEILSQLPVRRPSVPVWSATLAAPYPDDEAEVRAVAVRHLVEPVRFRELIGRLYDHGTRAFVQVGTGSLSSFVEDTLKGCDVLCVDAASAKVDGLDQLRRVLAALWVEGRPGIDPGALAPRSSDAGGRPEHVTGGGPPSTPTSSGGGQRRVNAPDARPLRLGAPLVRLGADAPQLAIARSRPVPVETVFGRGAGAPGAGAPGPADASRPAACGTGVATPPVPAGPPMAAAAGSGDRVAAALRLLLDDVASAAHAVAAAAGELETAGTAARPAPVGVVWGARTPTARTAALPAAARPRAQTGPGHRRATPTVGAATPTAPAPAAPARPPAGPGFPVPAAPAVPAGAAPEPLAVPPAGTGVDGRRSWSMPVSLAAMPWLVDHAFFHMPPDWPEPGDRFPVVPMTATVQLVVDEAEQAVPGRVVTGIRVMRAMRWTSAVPPIEVTVRSTPTGTDEVRVVLDGYAKGTVTVADSYPDPPQADRRPLVGARPAPHSASEMYEQRWMFHGPSYRTVVELGPFGDDGLVGRIRCGSAPGSLLDGAGQLVGYWVHMSQTYNQMALPSVIGHIAFFGPHPPVGAELDCWVRITDLADDRVVADVDLADDDGRVWCRITGWEERRFVTDSATFEAFRWPEHSTISVRQPGGWYLVHEGWTDAATRELLVRNFADRAERAEYECLNPRQQRQWVLGRVAAKDAVRRWLWDHGAGPIYPIEVGLDHDDRGAPVLRSRVSGVDALVVSIAHTEQLGVALVGTGPVGIDVERLADRGDRFAGMITTPAEAALLEEVVRRGADPAFVQTSAWCAKEAVAKARGTGLEGRPRAYPVEAIEGHRLVVAGQIVETAVVTVEEGAYVVAWTGP
jgi:acyl transferase domain-containing protein/phosphopantetheinyl transferase